MSTEQRQVQGNSGRHKLLTIRRSLLVLGIFVGSQIAFGLGYYLFAGALGDTYPGLKTLDSEIVSLVSTISAGLLTLLWIAVDLGRFGRGFAFQIGFNAAEERLRHPILLLVLAFIGTRILVWTYRTIALPYLGLEDAVGGGSQMFAYIQENFSVVSFSGFMALAFLIGPIVEELVFRGYLQSALSRRIAPWLAIFFTSLVFILLHGPMILWPMYFMHSVLLGWIYAHTKSIKLAIAFHMLNNFYYLVAALSGLSWLR